MVLCILCMMYKTVYTCSVRSMHGVVRSALYVDDFYVVCTAYNMCTSGVLIAMCRQVA